MKYERLETNFRIAIEIIFRFCTIYEKLNNSGWLALYKEEDISYPGKLKCPFSYMGTCVNCSKGKSKIFNVDRIETTITTIEFCVNFRKSYQYNILGSHFASHVFWVIIYFCMHDIHCFSCDSICISYPNILRFVFRTNEQLINFRNWAIKVRTDDATRKCK